MDDESLAPEHESLPADCEAALLLACLEHESSARRATLERLCGEHPERAAVLQRMFAALDALGLVEDPEPELPLPQQFGPYRVLRVLGSGGMGIVYLAEHLTLGRRAAVKVIHAAFQHAPRARERFRREALAASQLEHPAICSVYEVGEEAGVPYLAMRHVPGTTLAERIAGAVREGRSMVELPGPTGAAGDALSSVLQLVETLARALHVAHEAGLVHRDVKPSNVVVTHSGEPVLLDFGLARVTEAVQGDGATLSGDPLGTPAYMAPEQLTGVTGAVDRRSDVHALGVVLYECLTLRTPFAGVNRESLFQAILRQDPPDPRRHNARIGSDLRIVLETALAKEPDRRYATALALAEDLRRVRSHEPILARRVGPLLRLQRFARRNPLAAAFVAALTLALLGSVLMLAQRNAALATRDAVTLAFRADDVSRRAPQLGLRLAMRAVAIEPNHPGTISALFAVLARSRERVRLLGHSQVLWGATFSPDGTRILTWSDDATARLWDRRGAQLAEFPHRAMVQVGAFSPQGDLVVTASVDGTAALWTLAGHRVAEMPHGDVPAGVDLPKAMLEPDAAHMVLGAVFSPDGERVLTTCSDRRVRVWNRRGEPLGMPFEGHRQQGPLGRVATWSPTDPDLVATSVDWVQSRPSSDDFSVLLWRPSSGQVVATFSGHTGSVHWLEFAPDGQSILTAAHDRTARVLGLDGVEQARLVGHTDTVWRAHFSADGDRIVTASFDRSARLWRRDGLLLATCWHGAPVLEARLASDGSRVLTGGWDGAARVFRSDGLPLMELRGHGHLVFDVRFSPDEQDVLTASFDSTAALWSVVGDPYLPLWHCGGSVRGLARRGDTLVATCEPGAAHVWDLRTGLERSFPLAGPPYGAVLSEGADRLLVPHLDGISRQYDLHSGTELEQYPDRGGLGGSALFLVDGRVLTSGWSGELQVWEGKPAEGTEFGRHEDRVYALAHSPRTDLVASGSWDGTIRLADPGGRLVAEWAAHRGWVNGLAFSPSGELLLSGSQDHSLAVWRIDGTPLLRDLRGHDGAVAAVAWSPDGTMFASASHDGTVRLWRAADGGEIAVLRAHQGQVTALVFTDDGRLFTGGDDGTVRGWPAGSEQAIEHAERCALPLTESERAIASNR